MEGLLPEVRPQIIANFYGKNVSKTKIKNAIYRVMQLVDARESDAPKEGQGRPRKRSGFLSP